MTPLTLMVWIIRVCILLAFILPVLLFGPGGVIFSVLFGGAAWMIGTLTLYGVRVMCHTSGLREWLWYHVTFWTEDALED